VSVLGLFGFGTTQKILEANERMSQWRWPICSCHVSVACELHGKLSRPLVGQQQHTIVYADGGLDTQSPHPQCPKCRALMDGLAWVQSVEPFVNGAEPCAVYGCPNGEHLHRECSTCRYGRWERCADDPEAGESA
jgi:hypothetical protein